MKRRTLLAGFCLTTLAACAARQPKPPLKPNDLGRIGLLPIKEWPDSRVAQFNRAINPRQTFASSTPPISSMMLGMAIGQALLAAKEADRENLANAIARTDFNPERVLFNAIRSGFELRTTPIEVLESADWASRIRKDEVVDLPVAVDAILDVQISSAGYYPIGRGAGFSPYFRVSARLLDMVNRGEIIDEFSYEGDYEKSSGDSRYFTTPPSLSQPSLASFEANAESIRAGLVSTFERLASKIVDDVIRVRDKQARID